MVASPLPLLVGGVLLYAGRKPLYAIHARLSGRLDARAIFERSLFALYALARAVTTQHVHPGVVAPGDGQVEQAVNIEVGKAPVS